MAQDVNIKIKVDTSQASNSTDNYKKRLKELKDEMTALQVETDGLSNATADQRKRFAELEAEAGKIADAMGDAQQRIKNLSDDYAGMTAALEGVGAAVGGITAVSGAMELLGGDSEVAQESIKKVTSLMAILQGVQSVQKALNKDSAAMAALRNIKEKLLTTTIQQQTTAQLALNAAKLGAIGAITALVAVVGTLIVKYAKAKNAAVDLTKELNKQAAEAIAQNVAQLDKLSEAWGELGGDLEAQKQFLDDNKAAIEGMGLAFKDVNEAENFFQNQTDQYVAAITARAKAEAARAKIIEETKKQLEAEMEAERVAAGELTFWEEASVKMGKVSQETLVAIAEAEVDATQETIDKLKEKAKAYEEEAEAAEAPFKAMQARAEEGKKADEARKAAQEALTKSYEKTATAIKLKYADAINNASNASDKLKETKAQQSELLQAEIDHLEKLNKTLDKNSNEYLKNALRLKELAAEKSKIYEVTEALEEEELDYAAIVDETTKSTIASIQQRQEERKNAEKDWHDFEIAEEQRALEEIERLETEKEKIREAKWETAALMVNAYSTLVNTAMEAELEAAEGNEEEQKRIRKKYARSKFLAQIGSIGVSTAQAIMEAWSSVASIMFPGNVIAGGVLTAMLAATGIAQTMKARAEMDNALKAARGGILNGPSHAQGGIVLSNGVEAEGGEAIINKKSTAAFAPLLSEINSFNGYGAPLISSASASGGSMGAASDEAIRRIVAATVEGVTSIPVVVSEHAVTEAQRTVRLTKERSLI